MRKINGKELSAVMDELNKPFEAHDVDFGGHPIIPYEAIRERANQVLGLNYSDEHTIMHKEVEGEHVVCVDMKISIFDDEGALVASRSHSRSSILTRYSKGEKKGKISFDNDDFSSTVSLAFKKAFTKFGLGDQFAVANALLSMDHKVEPKVGRTNEGPRKLKGYLTLLSKVSDENGTHYNFQKNSGETAQFTVVNPEEVKNYVKLASMDFGSSAEVIFTVPDLKILAVV